MYKHRLAISGFLSSALFVFSACKLPFVKYALHLRPSNLADALPNGDYTITNYESNLLLNLEGANPAAG